MRTLYPNFDNEDGLETVLEVPLPEEVFTSTDGNAYLRWHNMRSRIKAQLEEKQAPDDLFLMLLKIVSSPVIPYQPPFFQAHIALPSVKEGSFVSTYSSPISLIMMISCMYKISTDKFFLSKHKIVVSL